MISTIKKVTILSASWLMPLLLLTLFLSSPLAVSQATAPPATGTPGISSSLSKKEQEWIKQNPQILVSNEFDWPPFDFVLSGKPQGFGIDLMNLLSEKSGIRFSYVNGYTWDELVEQFFFGKIDLLHSLSRTPERAKKAFFSEPYYHSKNVLILRNDVPTTAELNDLDGKIIALPKGWSSIEFFEKYFPNIHIIEVSSSRQALEYVDQGKVFATVEQEGIAAYFIKKFGFTDLKLSSWIDNDELQKTSSMHFAVKKDNPILFGILKKALATIQPDDMAKLEQKWFSRQGRKIGKEDAGLTPAEREYLQTKGKITVCIAPARLPFEAIQGGQPTGMTSDFLEIFSEQLNTPFTLTPTNSWSKSLAGIKAGSCDILPMVNSTRERKEYINFTTPYLRYNVALLTRENASFIQGLQDLNGKQVGIPEDSFLWDLVPKKFPEVSFLPFRDAEQGLLQLSAGHLDAALLTLPTAAYHIRRMGLDNLKVAGYSGFKNKIRIGVRKEDVLLHSIMSKIIRSLPQKDIESVYQKWVVLKFEHQLNYSLLWKIAAAGISILMVIIVWNRKLMRLNRKIAAQHQELKQISMTDELTGLFNRRHMDAALSAEIKRFARYKRQLSIIMLDIDFFKNVNDKFGHQVGDKVLCQFAETLLSNIRECDTVGRWGGEEFLIICPESDIKGCLAQAEHLRQAIEKTSFPSTSQTASFGVADYLPSESIYSFIKRADDALYRAKNNGRNRAEAATQLDS